MALERLTLPAWLLTLIERRRTLETALRQVLPEELSRHVFLLNVRGETLVLGCDVHALITPLRFKAPELLAAVRAHLRTHPPVRVAWRTLPPAAPPMTSANRPRFPSSEVAEGIAAAARHVSDPHLSAALHQLARTLYKKACNSSS